MQVTANVRRLMRRAELHAHALGLYTDWTSTRMWRVTCTQALTSDATAQDVPGTTSTRQRTGMRAQMSSVDARVSESQGYTASSIGTSVRPSTLGSNDGEMQLKQALDNLRLADPPAAFAQRYLLLAERVSGGQGVVQVLHLLIVHYASSNVVLAASQNCKCDWNALSDWVFRCSTSMCDRRELCMQFARSKEGGYQQYAIKFFLKASDFPVESQLYAHALVSNVLPQLVFAADNSDRAYISHSGFQFPPFLVMERGSSLSEYASNASLQSETQVCNNAHACATVAFSMLSPL